MINIIIVASLTTFLGDLGHAKALQTEIQQLLPDAKILPLAEANVEGYQALKERILRGSKEDRYIIISIGEIGITQFEQISNDKDFEKSKMALVWGGHQYLPELEPLIGKLDIIDLPEHERSQIENKLRESKTHLVTAIGVPHDFTKGNLQSNLDKWKKEIEEAVGEKQSCIAVVLGGDAPDRKKQTYKFTPPCATEFGNYVKLLAKQNDAAVIITAGGRTSKEALSAFMASFENEDISYKLFDAKAKGASYALLAFLNTQALSFDKKLKIQSFITFDSITMGTAAFETQPLGTVVAVGVDSMSESHLDFANMAYRNGLVSYLKWQPDSHTYNFLPQEKAKGLKFFRESAAKTLAKGVIRALTELDFFSKQGVAPKEAVTYSFNHSQTEKELSASKDLEGFVKGEVYYV